MKIHPDFITECDEDELRCHIEIALNRMPQRKRDGRNRILRFGCDYENPKKWITDWPDWTSPDWWTVEYPFMGFDSVTLNEYRKNQSIAPHIDSKAFGDVAILSLLSDVVMRFTSPVGEMREFVLPRRSLAVMSGELRHKWQHSTLPLDADKRLSIVYRRRLT